MVRTQIQLTEEQSEQLKTLAQLDKVSVAELIRQSVDSFLSSRGIMSQEERKRRALSVIGIARSGLGDLSVNHDKYLAEIYAEVGE